MSRRRYLLFAVALTLSACAIDPLPPPSLAVLPAPPQPAQRIPVTLRLPWPSILAIAEKAVPSCDNLGDDNTCTGTANAGVIFADEDDWEPVGRSWLGVPIGTKGTIWRRDPLVVKVAGKTISGSLRMLYRARIGLGGRQVASCGYTDPPRDITVKFTGTFAYASGWYIDPTFDVDAEPGAPCTVTMFNFDITPLLAKAISDSLQDYAEVAENQIRQITNMHDRIAGIWTELDEPMDIGTDIWLEMNPIGVAAGALALTDDGRHLVIPMVLKASPTVIAGAKPRRASVPLPPLAAGDVRPEFSISIRGLVTYAEASATLTRLLRENGVSNGPSLLRGIRIENATVSGSANKVVIAIEIGGLYSGTLYLFGTPRFESRTTKVAGGFLVIDDVDYTIETQSIMARIGSALYANQIREALESLARWDVSDELREAQAELAQALNRDFASVASMTGRLSEFGPGGVRVGPNGLEAWYRVEGTLEVIVNPF